MDYADRVGGGGGPVELVTDQSRGNLLVLLGDDPLLANLQDVEHEVVLATGHELELRVQRKGLEVTRRISIDDTGYGGRLKVSIKNRADVAVQPPLPARLVREGAGVRRSGSLSELQPGGLGGWCDRAESG